MKKKIISLYIISFIFIFIIITILDFLYKKYAINLNTATTYLVSAPSAFSLKERSYQNLLDRVLINNKNKDILDRNKILIIKNYKVFDNALTTKINNANSTITYELVLFDKIDPITLEEELNNEYLNSINEIINTIKKNNYLFDYKLIESEYSNFELNEINKIYQDLLDLEFFRIFSAPKCTQEKKICLERYLGYYKYVVDKFNLNGHNEFFFKQFGINSKDESLVLDVIQQFYFFDIQNLIYSFENSDNSTLRHNFFSKKYDLLLNSNFFKNYIKNPEEFCRTYRKGCFIEVSDYFNTLLFIHLTEQKNKYKVELVKKKTKEKNLIKELPKNLGIAIFLTYILFIFTNKFFNRKLR